MGRSETIRSRGSLTSGVPDAVTTGDLPASIVLMRVDIAHFGSGEYVFVVLKVGRKWVELFHAASLSRVRVAKDEFAHKASPVAMKAGHRARFAHRLRKDIKNRKRWGISDGGKAAVIAARIIGGRAA